jgi:hypothetical protein
LTHNSDWRIPYVKLIFSINKIPFLSRLIYNFFNYLIYLNEFLFIFAILKSIFIWYSLESLFIECFLFVFINNYEFKINKIISSINYDYFFDEIWQLFNVAQSIKPYLLEKNVLSFYSFLFQSTIWPNYYI